MIAPMSISSSSLPPMFTRNTQLIVLLTALCINVCTKSYGDTAVATTIRPLQFIALAIIGENGSVSSLIEAGSPHDFNLSPSDRLLLADSDLILWVGKELEAHLSGSMDSIATEAAVVAALELPGLITHSIGENRQLDAHIWLDTRNALRIAEKVADVMTLVDSGNADFYRSNLAGFSQDLASAADEISNQLTDASDVPFLVYHNAFQYFEKQFELRHGAALVQDPEQSPTIAEIIATRNAVAQLQPRCLVREPDANDELIRTTMGAYSAKNPVSEVTVDLLGANIEPNSAAYIALINSVADAFTSCLNNR